MIYWERWKSLKLKYKKNQEKLKFNLDKIHFMVLAKKIKLNIKNNKKIN
jgi:hypothetical protein